MNKIISFVLLGALLLMCFSGCATWSNANGDKGINQGNTPDTNNKYGDIPVIIEGELDKNSDLVVTLVAYLEQYWAEYDMPETSTAIKINEIKNGTQALLAGFNESSYYFVGAYYNSEHTYEPTTYCCATNYTWVGFKSENEISEKYNGLDFVVAFQINNASLVSDITANDASVPSFAHFQIYKTAFDNGLNTNTAVVFDDSFIYLNTSESSNVYHSVDMYNHCLITISCVFLNEQYYIAYEVYSISPDGARANFGWKNDFGEYYDALISIMNTESNYSLTNDRGYTYFYGLIGIDDFAKCIHE